MVTGMMAVLGSVMKNRRECRSRVQREAEEVCFGLTEDKASSKEVKGREEVWQ